MYAAFYDIARKASRVDIEIFYEVIVGSLKLYNDNIEAADIEPGVRLAQYLRDTVKIPEKTRKRRGYGRKMGKATEQEYSLLIKYFK